MTALLTLAAAPVHCQRVAIGRAGAVEASRCVVAAIGANMAASGKGALINICVDEQTPIETSQNRVNIYVNINIYSFIQKARARSFILPSQVMASMSLSW